MKAHNQHDFKPAIEKTSVENAKVILETYLKNFSLFVYEDNEETGSEEFTADIVEKTTDFAIQTMAFMAATDIPADYATYSIDKIIAGLEAIKRFIDGQLRQHEDEIMARSLGAKSPVTNTYAKDCATLGEVMLTLKKIREATGNNPDDYFIPKIKPEELSTDAPIVSEGEE